MTSPNPEAVSLICDHMLGTLARWLRLLGFDTSYPDALEDDEILRVARKEGRLLLTRDRDLGGRRGVDVLYVSSDVLDEQMVQVLRDLHLSITEPLRRCPVCNAVLLTASKSDALGNVPEGVYNLHEEFWRCPGCERFYWQGTHWARITRKVEEYRAASSDIRSPVEPVSKD